MYICSIIIKVMGIMMTYKAELVENNEVVKTFEEETNENWSSWRFKKALDELKPKGREIRWFINGDRKLS
jgi:hypothetical protein